MASMNTTEYSPGHGSGAYIGGVVPGSGSGGPNMWVDP